MGVRTDRVVAVEMETRRKLAAVHQHEHKNRGEVIVRCAAEVCRSEFSAEQEILFAPVPVLGLWDLESKEMMSSSGKMHIVGRHDTGERGASRC